MGDQSQIGAKLGPRLADLMSKAVVSTTAQLTPHKVRGGMQLQESFFRLIGSEVSRTVAGLTRELADHPENPEWLRKTLGFMAEETGQFAAIMNWTVYGSGIGNSIAGIITNTMAPAVWKALSANPNALIPPDGLADLVARRVVGVDYGRSSSANQGISGGKFDWLVAGAVRQPDVGTILELYRRGRINREEAEKVLGHIGLPGQYLDKIPDLARELLSASDLANLVDRNAMSENEAESRAQQVGLAPDDFRRIVELVGVPPDAGELLLAYRRGVIDKARLLRGIRQSPLRSEWFDVIESLQFERMSTADAIEATVQSHISHSEAKRIAQENGLDVQDFDTLVETAGIPPGPQELLDFMNRGLISEADVRQAISESRVKNKYIDLYIKTARKILPNDTVRQMLRNNVIDDAEAITMLRDLGYSQRDAAALAALAHAQKTQVDKDLTKSEVINLYEYLAISKSAAEKMLTELGYDVQESAWLILLSDLRRQKRETDAAAGVVRSKYVAHKITDQEASTALDTLRVPSEMRDHLLNIWGLERDANTTELTKAEIIKYLEVGFIDRANATARLLAKGYDAGDVNLLISYAIGPVGG